jgi:hypothetical protein
MTATDYTNDRIGQLRKQLAAAIADAKDAAAKAERYLADGDAPTGPANELLTAATEASMLAATLRELNDVAAVLKALN